MVQNFLRRRFKLVFLRRKKFCQEKAKKCKQGNIQGKKAPLEKNEKNANNQRKKKQCKSPKMKEIYPCPWNMERLARFRGSRGFKQGVWVFSLAFFLPFCKAFLRKPGPFWLYGFAGNHLPKLQKLLAPARRKVFRQSFCARLKRYCCWIIFKKR